MNTFRKIAITAIVAPVIALGSATGAQAAPGPAEERIYCGPSQVQIGVTCQDRYSRPTTSKEQESLWQALVFGALGTVWAFGTLGLN